MNFLIHQRRIIITNMAQTETQERFEAKLKETWMKINEGTFSYGDGMEVYALSENLLIHYGQVRKSRDKWKEKYKELKRKKD